MALDFEWSEKAYGFTMMLFTKYYIIQFCVQRKI